MMKESLKLGVILFLITAVCVGVLGAVNQITYPIIEENNAKTELTAMQQLIHEADAFSEVDITDGGVVKKGFVAKQKEEVVGYVLRVAPNGYGGPIELLVGLGQSLEIKGIKILSHSETPGFGANADKPEFIGQYQGQSGKLTVTKTLPQPGEIQAITGATITSAAITEGVNLAADYVQSHQAEWGEVQ